VHPASVSAGTSTPAVSQARRARFGTPNRVSGSRWAASVTPWRDRGRFFAVAFRSTGQATLTRAPWPARGCGPGRSRSAVPCAPAPPRE
jgi:hypothetical protein